MSRILRTAAAAACLLISIPAFATTTTWGFVGALQEFRDVISGPVAQALGILGVVGCVGALVWGGEMNQFVKTLVYLVLVICVLITANGFVNWLAGISGTSVSSGARVASMSPVPFGTPDAAGSITARLG